MNIELVADSANLSLEQNFVFTIFYLTICLNNQGNWRSIVHYGFWQILLIQSPENVLFFKSGLLWTLNRWNMNDPVAAMFEVRTSNKPEYSWPTVNSRIIVKYDSQI